jgi:single-strand DNA-binding protein
MNTVTLIGTLTRDPEVREHSKTKVCDIRVAESGARKESPMYINVSAFGRQAEVCEQYLVKGRQVAVAGQLRFREWQGEDGAKRSEHTIAADRIDFLSGNGEGGGNGGGGGGAARGRSEGRRGNGNGRPQQRGGGGQREGGGARPQQRPQREQRAPREETLDPEEF